MSDDTRAAKVAEVKDQLRGLTAAVNAAQTEEDWKSISKRAGAVQRRTRALGGLPRGG